jgi:hypothetical protein
MAYRSSYQSPAGPIPNGNAFLVQTPETDNARDQILAEQRQREMFAQREAMQTDQQMAKEFANVRSVDLPEVMQKYNAYKQTQIQMMRNPHLLNNPLAYAQASQAGTEALGEVYGLINDSHNAKQMAQDINKVYEQHPDKFADPQDYRTLMDTYLKTPTSKLGNVNLSLSTGAQVNDLSTPEAFMYKGSNTNFGAIDKAAQGVVGTKGRLPDVITAKQGDPLSNTRTTYLFGNTPLQYKSSFYGGLGPHLAGRDAGATWDKLVSDHPEIINQVNQQFAAIPADRWQKMTGSATPQNLEPDDPTDKAEQLASFRAKQYAVNAPINQVSHDEPNREAIKTLAQNNWLANEKVRQNDRIAIANVNMRNAEGKTDYDLQSKQYIASQSAAAQTRLAKENFDYQTQSAMKMPAEKVEATDGTVRADLHPMETQTAVENEFKIKTPQGHDAFPSQMYTDGQGNVVAKITYKDSQDNDVTVLKSKPISTLIDPWKKSFGTAEKGNEEVPPPGQHHKPGGSGVHWK